MAPSVQVETILDINERRKQENLSLVNSVYNDIKNGLLSENDEYFIKYMDDDNIDRSNFGDYITINDQTNFSIHYFTTDFTFDYEIDKWVVIITPGIPNEVLFD